MGSHRKRVPWIVLVLREVCRPIQAIRKIEAEERGAVIIDIPNGLMALFSLGLAFYVIPRCSKAAIPMLIPPQL